jgi:hypothetical protein
MHIRHIAENITQPIVGTITANNIPNPIQNARKPTSLFFLRMLIIYSPIALPGQSFNQKNTVLHEKTVIKQVSDYCNNSSYYKIPQNYRNESGNQEH